MEPNGYKSGQVVSLMGELMQGLALARQLKAHTCQNVSGESETMLLEEIICSLEKSLFIVKWCESMEQSQQQQLVPFSTMSGSPFPVESSKNEALNQGSNAPKDNIDLSKKRKMIPDSTKQEKVRCSDNDADRPPEDGYSWRKYGQKDILGAKHHRSYYRCTYRKTQGCFANKQVQRNDVDPLIFDITYKGSHTCKLVAQCSKTAPMSQAKQVPEEKNILTSLEHQQNMMMNFHHGVENDIQLQNLENQDGTFPSTINDNIFYHSFQPINVLSPVTSESNIVSSSPCKMKTVRGFYNGQQAESDITEMISASTSTTNSPIDGIDFSLNKLEFHPCFPYDAEEFISQFFSS